MLCCVVFVCFADKYKKGDTSFKDAESYLFLFGIHSDCDFESYSEGTIPLFIYLCILKSFKLIKHNKISIWLSW